MFFTQILTKVEVEVVKPHFESSHGGHHQHEGQSHGGGLGNFRGRWSCGGHGVNHRGQQPNNESNYYFYEKHGHMAKNCYQREHDAQNGKL
jgi:hypothetical protein